MVNKGQQNNFINPEFLKSILDKSPSIMIIFLDEKIIYQSTNLEAIIGKKLNLMSHDYEYFLKKFDLNVQEKIKRLFISKADSVDEFSIIQNDIENTFEVEIRHSEYDSKDLKILVFTTLSSNKQILPDEFKDILKMEYFEKILILFDDKLNMTYQNETARLFFKNLTKESKTLATIFGSKEILNLKKDIINLSKSSESSLFFSDEKSDSSIIWTIRPQKITSGRITEYRMDGIKTSVLNTIIFSSNISNKLYDKSLILLRSILDSFPDTIAILDTNYRIRFFNKSALKMWNVKTEEIITSELHCFECIGRKTACEDCAVSEVLKTKKPAQKEKFIKNTNRWIDNRAFPILDDEGNLLSIIEHIRDITSLKEAEEFLRLDACKSELLLNINKMIDSSCKEIIHLFMDGIQLILNCKETIILLKNEKTDLIDLYFNSNVFESFTNIESYSLLVEFEKLYLSFSSGFSNIPGKINIDYCQRVFKYQNLNYYRINRKSYYDLHIIAINNENSFDKNAHHQLVDLAESFYQVMVKKFNKQELIKSEERNSQVIALTQQLIYEFYNNHGNRKVFGDSLSILGYHNSEINEKLSWWDIINPEDLDIVKKEIEKAVKNFDKYVITYRIKSKHGNEIYVKDIGIPQKHHNIHKINYLGCIKNITDNYLSQKNLQDRERWFFTTLSSIGDAVIATDNDGNIVFMNKIAENLTGWSMEDAKGLKLNKIFKIYNETTGKKVNNPVDKVLATGQIIVLANQTVLFSKDGKRYPISDSGAPIIDSKGNIDGVVLVFRDVTEQRKINKALLESESKYRTLYESMREVFSSFDLDGNITEMNASGLRLFGYNQKKMLKMNIFDLTYPEDLSFEKRIIQEQVNLNGFSDTYRKRMIREDGSIIPVECRVYLSKNIADEVVGYWIFIRDITLRTNYEEALKKSEERLKMGLDAAQEGLWDWKLKTREIYNSHRCFEMLGYKNFTPEDPITFWHNIIHPDDLYLFKDALKLMLSNNQRRFSIELRMKNASGEYQWIQNIGHPVEYDETGKVSRIIGVHINIDDRKKMELVLRENEEKYKTLVENSSDSILIIQDNIIKFANKAVENLSGYKSEEITNTQIGSKQTTIGKNSINDYLSSIQELGNKPFELELMRKDKKKVYCDAVSKNITYEGKPALMCFFHDVTERKEAEKALAESEQKLRAQYKNIPVPTYTWQYKKGEFILVDFNDAAISITQGMIKQYLGRNAQKLYLSIPEMHKNIKKCFDNKISFKDTLSYNLESTGEFKHFDIKYAYVPNDLVMVHTEDITEQINAANERKNIEVKLLASSKLATLGEMATGMAHEVNQPLHYIGLFLQILLEDIQSNNFDIAYVSDMAKKSYQSVERIRDIINHLQLFGRSSETQVHKVDMSKVLDNTLILTNQRLVNHNIKFISDIDKKLKPLHINENQMEQVLINLFQNSIDALNFDSDDKEIRINMKNMKNNFILEFEDNGIGMPDHVVTKIFEPFFTTKEVGTGTGLGLSIVHGIITDFGGTIQCESSQNNGAKFVITLPITKGNNE